MCSTNDKQLISVIVPVYNAEKKLRRSVGSLLSQTYTRLEVILVDDGSQDSSYAVCMELSQADSRVRVIHMENRGLSRARNVGLDNAEGKYVVFCDADDRMAPEAVMCLYQCMDDDVQLGVVGACFEYEDGSVAVWRQFEDKLYTRSDDCGMILRYGTVWGKIFRRDLIEAGHLRFVEEVCTEDCLFMWSYLGLVSAMKASSCIGYYYLKENNHHSISSHLRPALWWEKNHDILLDLYETVSDFNVAESDRIAIRSFVSEAIFNSIVSSYAKDLGRHDRKRIFRKAKKAEGNYRPDSGQMKLIKTSVVLLPFCVFDIVIRVGRSLFAR